MATTNKKEQKKVFDAEVMYKLLAENISDLRRNFAKQIWGACGDVYDTLNIHKGVLIILAVAIGLSAISSLSQGCKISDLNKRIEQLEASYENSDRDTSCVIIVRP